MCLRACSHARLYNTLSVLELKVQVAWNLDWQLLRLCGYHLTSAVLCSVFLLIYPQFNNGHCYWMNFSFDLVCGTLILPMNLHLCTQLLLS